MYSNTKRNKLKIVSSIVLFLKESSVKIKAKCNRIYLDFRVGDRVKIYTKKTRFDKERKRVWSKHTYILEELVDSLGQTFIK